jgi:hypothetical protein
LGGCQRQRLLYSSVRLISTGAAFNLTLDVSALLMQ